MERFSTLILRQLNRTLATVGVAIAVSVWVYAIFEMGQNERRVGKLIMSQVESLGQAQVNAQDVLGLQKELSRFIEDWNTSQPIEARVEVRLDGTKAALAGPTQPFRGFYSVVNRRLRLPSGSEIQIELQLGHFHYWMQIAVTIAVLEALLIILFVLLNRRIGRLVHELSRPLERSARWIDEIASDLPRSAKNHSTPGGSEIIEVQVVRQSVSKLADEIVGLEDKLTKSNFDRGRLNMADQVVHDIRSPLATIDLRVSKLKEISAEEKDEIRAPIRRIQDIINTLLDLRRQARATAASGERLSVVSPTETMEEPAELLFPLIEEVVSEKRIQYSRRSKVRIEGPQPADSYAFCAKVDSTEFQRIISNLIDNAVEAIAEDGFVIVKTSEDRSFHRIEVADTGKGISTEELSRVVGLGESIGKPSGSGMGLQHARQWTATWGGTLSIESVPSMGTTVRIDIPRAKLPPGLLRTLDLTQVSSLTIVDDDPSVHALWRMRVGSLRTSLAGGVQYFFTPDEFLAEPQAVGGTNAVCLIDYDFGPGRMTGIELIERAHLANRAILVTSRFADEKILSDCGRLGINRIPKDWIGFISIRANEEFEQANGNAIGQGEAVSALLMSTDPNRVFREVGV